MAHIINIYRLTAKARRHIVLGGMEKALAVPQPLSVRDISDVLEAWPSPLPRNELDPCIFRLDAEDIATWEEGRG
ncbi:hypothetical protein ACSBPU_12755 [Parapusillimonas sp. JC17]|uniref:hypothetical protein n=1 Tax=Parapusillimonas sp. JC17 TaxID=3445768 RepID=UPI003F9EED5F